MTTFPGTTHTPGGSRLAIIGATALTLAALAGFVGWHLRTEQQGPARAPATTAISVDAGQTHAAQDTVRAAPAPPAAVVARQPETRVILVSSEAQAAELHASARDWNMLRMAHGLLPIDTMTVVVTSEVQPLNIRRAMEEASLHNAMEGRPLVVVEDARYANARPIMSDAATSEPAPASMYLVDAPEVAAWLRQIIADFNGLRREFGQAPRNDIVIETTPDAEYVAAFPRPPNMTIYDLRQPVAGNRPAESGTRP